MEIKSFKAIEGNALYVSCPILTTEKTARCHKINLYDRIGFVDEFAIKKYICIYKNCPILVPRDTIDKTAHVIFERTINPNLDPRIYVCIKIGDKMREDLDLIEIVEEKEGY